MSRHVGRQFVIVLLFLLPPAGSVGAGEGEGKAEDSREEAKKKNAEMLKQMLASTSAQMKFVGDERISEAEAKSVIAHYQSFDELMRGKGDDAPAKRLEAHYKKTGNFDYSLIPKMKEYKQWATRKGVDGKAWLRRALRASAVHQREELADGLDEYRKQVENLEKMASRVDDEGLSMAAEESRWILTLSEKTVALIPAPTEEEKKVFKKHGKALAAAFGADRGEAVEK